MPSAISPPRGMRQRAVLAALFVALLLLNFQLAVALFLPLLGVLGALLLLPPTAGALAALCAAAVLTDIDSIKAGAGTAPWVPTPADDLKALLAQINRTAAVGATFCDMGSGDGRNLILATRHAGFTRGIGVEHSPLLAAISRLRIWWAGANASIVVGDVLTAALPADVDVIYFYLARDTLAQLAPRLRAAYGGRSGHSGERKPVLVLSRDFSLPGWGEPIASLDRGRTRLLAYEVPAVARVARSGGGA